VVVVHQRLSNGVADAHGTIGKLLSDSASDRFSFLKISNFKSHGTAPPLASPAPAGSVAVGVTI